MGEAYDTDNVFAKILRGELPAHRICEDERTLAFLDIMPRAPGHTLVIPKAASRNLLDVADDDLAAVARAVQRVTRAAMTAFAADGVTITQFNEAAAGQVVFHLHFHIIPRHEGVAMKPPASAMEDQKVLAGHAEKLRAALG